MKRDNPQKRLAAFHISGAPGRLVAGLRPDCSGIEPSGRLDVPDPQAAVLLCELPEESMQRRVRKLPAGGNR